MRTVVIVSAGVLVISMFCRAALAGEQEITFDKLTKVVADALKTRFPNAEIKGASKEQKEGKAVYEVALKHPSSRASSSRFTGRPGRAATGRGRAWPWRSGLHLPSAAELTYRAAKSAARSSPSHSRACQAP